MSKLTKKQLKAEKEELVVLHRGQQVTADRTKAKLDAVREEIKAK
jgi:hypothetical protein